MVGRKENEDQIDWGRANLHKNSIREIASGGFRIGLARKCSCELKCGLSRRACVMGRHGMNALLVGAAILLDPWVHPFRTVLGQFFIVAPHVRMVVVELG